jgi:hypothetical protein
MINWLDDVGAPAVVTAINIGSRASTATIFGSFPVADAATYGMTVLGYAAAAMGWGGKYNGFLKNVGIAAAPLAMEKIYNQIKGTPATSRVSYRMNRIARYPGPAEETPFQGVRLA